jgi:hypothetical protein
MIFRCVAIPTDDTAYYDQQDESSSSITEEQRLAPNFVEKNSAGSIDDVNDIVYTSG